MALRAIARLVVVSAAAVGVLTLALHLGDDGPTTGGSASYEVAAEQPRAAARPQDTRSQDVQSSLERGLVRPNQTNETSPATSEAVAPVDETQPHGHVVDPETGGLIPVAGAAGRIPAADHLGPVHVDPLPAGVDLSDPVDTASLLERAGVAATTLDDQPTTAAFTPAGTPSITSLSQHVAPSCSGTGTDGKRVQALYVHEADTGSRFTQVLPVLRDEVANVDDVFAVSSEQTGGSRRVRWVHDSSCHPVIADVTVPDGALGDDFWGTVNALKSLGYKDPSRKYMIFADANEFCGIGTLYNDTRLTNNYNDGFAASYARIDANCWSVGHSVPAHELVHNMGGVQKVAPHSTTNGHCFDESDLMCYNDGSGIPMQKICGSAQEYLLDCNKDDYFNTDPAAGTFLANNWNTASSSFLDRPTAPATPPGVNVTASTASAQTGDAVTFTASSPKTVTWQWSTTSTCTLTPTQPAQAKLTCPSTSTGTKTVTATATDTTTGGVGTGSASVSVTKAAAPTAQVIAPSGADAGETFAVSVAATGKAPFAYTWSAGASCTVANLQAASTTVTCPSDTVSQQVALTSQVTQNDGQTAGVTTYVAVTGTAGPPPTPATTSWTTPRAQRGMISATLRNTDTGTVLTGRSVELQVLWNGTSQWVHRESVVTDLTGRATAAASFSKAGSFRFVFGGDDGHSGSVSAATYVKISTRASVSKPTRSLVAGHLETVSGKRVAGAAMALQRRFAGSTRWVTVSTERTDTRGNVDRRVNPPRKAYFRWHFRGEHTHVQSQSAARAVSG